MRLAHLRPQEPRPPQRQDRAPRRGPREGRSWAVTGQPRAQVPTQGQQRSSAHSPCPGHRAMPGPEGDGPRGWSAGGSAGQSAPWAPWRGAARHRCQPGGIRARPHPTPSHHLLPPPPPVQPAAGREPSVPGRSTTGPARPREEEGAREPLESVPYLGAGARRGEQPTAQGREPGAATQVRPARRQARSHLSARRAACGNLRRRGAAAALSAATHGPEVAPHGVRIRPNLLPGPDFSQGETLGSRLSNR